VELAARMRARPAELRNVRTFVLTAAALAALALPTTADASFRTRLGRAGLEDVRDEAAGIDVDLRYATKDNFTGKRLPGYCTAEPFLRASAARGLGQAQAKLASDGLGLRVFDAYRPSRASRAMVRWAKRTNREYLLHGLIAARSNHNRGAAVDLTLVRLDGDRELSMGTAFDSFSPKSATNAVKGKALGNRLRLKDAMEAEGFRNYSREWWHYDFPSELSAPRLDVALGC
jgi:D-alanyl-D-alanine dipeptidase